MTNILIIDDDEVSADLTKMLLEMEGYSAHACTDVGEAQTAATQNTVDAFVIDYHLTDEASGVDITRAIRAGRFGNNRDAVIIVTSGDYRRAPEAAAVGADTFLQKPYTPAVLTQQLKHLLASKEQHG